LVDPTISSAVIYSSLLGIMCVGLTLTYLTTKVPNFAHSDFVVVGFYTTFTLFVLDGFNPYLTIPAAVLVGSLSALLMYLLVLRPLSRKNSSLVILMIATLAIDIAFTGFVPAYADYLNSSFGKLIVSKGYTPYNIFPLPDISVFGVSGLLLFAPIILILLTIGLYLLLTRTRFGIAMRASIENPALATVLGINIERVYIFSWLLAGGLAGLAGSLYILQFSGTVNVSSQIIVSIFAGSILGGLGSIYGAILGGVLVGASEIFLTTWLSQGLGEIFGSGVGSSVLSYQKGIPLLIMIVALMLIPKGLVSINRSRIFSRSKAR
jgi:branched-chain amino acid transport system permease protein